LLSTLKLALDRTVTLANLAERLREAYGNRPALLPDLATHGAGEAAEETVSYTQMIEIGNRLANYLISGLDLKKGQRVLLNLEDQRALFLFMLGAVKAGALAVAVPPGASPERLEAIAGSSRPHVIISQEPLTCEKGTQVLPEELAVGLEKADSFFIPYTLKRVDAVAISYLDGPACRGVMSGNVNLVGPQRFLAALMAGLLRGAQAGAVIAPSLSQPEGLAAWTTCLMAGWAVQAISEHVAVPEVLVASPQQFREMAEVGLGLRDFPRTRLFVSWGGFLDGECAARFSGGQATLLECYGLAEAPPPLLVSLTRAGRHAGPDVKAWALPPQRVISRDGHLVSRGPNLTPGYWMDMEGTAQLLENRELPLPLEGHRKAGFVTVTRS